MRRRLRSSGVEVWYDFTRSLVVEYMTIPEAFTFARVCKSFRIHVVYDTKFEHVEFKGYKGRNRSQVCKLKSCYLNPCRPVHNFANLTHLHMAEPGRSKITKCPKLISLTVEHRGTLRLMDDVHQLRRFYEVPVMAGSLSWRRLDLGLLCNLEVCDVKSLYVCASDAIKHKKLVKLTCNRLVYDLDSPAKSDTLSYLSCDRSSTFLAEEDIYHLWQSMKDPIEFQYIACRVARLPPNMLKTPNLLVSVSDEFVQQPGVLVRNIDSELFVMKY